MPTQSLKNINRFPTPKVIAYDINEICSLHLAYADKLANENKDVIYLLVAVDRLSRYLRVERLKSKYATTQQMRLRKRLRTSNLKKCG